MPNTTHYGSLKTGTAGAAEQAAKIGAVIGPDGWWYLNGRRLSPQEADALTQQAGVAVQTTDDAHGERARDLWGKISDGVSKAYSYTPLSHVKIGGDVGNFLEHNKADIAAAAGTVLTGGNPLVGAAIKAGLEGAKRGASGLDAAKGAISGYGAGSLGNMGWNAAKGLAGTGAAAATGAGTGGASQIVGVAEDGSFIYGPAASGGAAAGTAAAAGSAGTGAATAGGLGGIAGGLGKALGGLSASDWLKAIGGGVEGAMNYKNQQGLLDQRKREFERTQGMAEGQQAVKAQQLLNAAPAADQAAYLLRARMGAAPQTFAPRDYTRTGPANMGVATGGPATQIAAGQQAAASYRPGMGGYNTDILDLFRKKMAAGLGA